MQTYLFIKSSLVASAVFLCLGMAFPRFKKLLALMRAVDGATSTRFNHIGKRLLVLFSNVFLQKNIRRKPIPGTAHMLIFFGFLAVQVHILELITVSFFQDSSLNNSFGIVYAWYSAIGEILVAGALIGIIYGLYRRAFIRPKHLSSNPDGFLILALAALIVITYFTANSFRISGGNTSAGLQNFFVVSNQISGLFHLSDLPRTELFWGFEVSFWAHLALLLFFLIYLPGSKHLHILAAIPNVALKSLAREKPMHKTDFTVLERDTTASIGYGKVSDLNWKDVLGLYSCTECGRCEELCPASLTGKPLSPKTVISNIKDELFTHSDQLLAQKGGKACAPIPPFVRKHSPITEEVIWACTTCRACEEICPVSIQHLDFLMEMRKNLVMMEAQFPHDLQPLFENLENQSNPWGLGNESRASWWKELNVKLMADHPDAEYLYYVGCAGYFDERGSRIAAATATLLQKAGIDFAVLGSEESCCGDPARRAGNEYLAQILIENTIKTINKYSPRRIITGCPHCFNALKNEFPEFNGNYEVIHHTVLIEELMRTGKLAYKKTEHGTLTYHDACYLGRWNDNYRAPRNIIKHIAGNKFFREMPHHQARALCCGAGGAHLFMEDNLGKSINAERFEEAHSTEAETVITACPYCNLMLTDASQACESTTQVLDIAEFTLGACA